MPYCYVGQELKEILISMEKAKVKKPFLGGYKNQLTEIEYHHASAQTLPKSSLGTGVWPVCINGYNIIFILIIIDTKVWERYSDSNYS